MVLKAQGRFRSMPSSDHALRRCASLLLDSQAYQDPAPVLQSLIHKVTLVVFFLFQQAQEEA